MLFPFQVTNGRHAIPALQKITLPCQSNKHGCLVLRLTSSSPATNPLSISIFPKKEKKNVNQKTEKKESPCVYNEKENMLMNPRRMIHIPVELASCVLCNSSAT